MKTALGLLASALLSTACVPHRTVIPDPTIPHRVAKEGELTIWARQPDGQLVKQEVRVLPGWWIAGPPVVEAER